MRPKSREPKTSITKTVRAVPAMTYITSFTPAARMLSVELPLLIMSMTKERMETASQPRMAFVLPNLSQVVPTIGLEEQIEERCSGYYEAAHHGAKTNLGSIRREELVHAASELNETEEADAKKKAGDLMARA